MTNFCAPFHSRSLAAFWTRWHISLSTWFRDYVYVPMGGNRVPPSRWAFNILVVFMLSGLWHGANWTFAVWGLYHGVMIVLERVVRPSARAGREAGERDLRRSVISAMDV